MVRYHRFWLSQFLWMVLLLGIASRLHAQESPEFPPTNSLSDPAVQQFPLGSSASKIGPTSADATPIAPVPGTPAEGPASETIEISDKNPPTPPAEKPTLEELLAQWDRYRKAHVPYHVRYRESIRPQSEREAKLMVTSGYPECREFVDETEFAFLNDRFWRRALVKLVDQKNLPTTTAPLKGAEYENAKHIPHPDALFGVFYKPFPKDCSLDFDGPYPHITVKGEFPGEKTEIWMMPASRWWFPKRIRQVIDGAKHDNELNDVVGAEWEVKHFKSFGANRAPEIVDGVHSVIYREGDEQTVFTTEWMITKLLLGGKVVPGEVDPSLGPTPAPPATAPTSVRAATETGDVFALPEFSAKATPTTELPAEWLPHALNQLEAFRKAHTPFHLRYRTAINVRNASEAKLLESIGYTPGKLFETEYESAFLDNRFWTRCLDHRVDGEQARNKHLGEDCIGTPGRDVPLPLLGVLIEPKREEVQLTFEGPLPHIMFTTHEQKDHYEILLFAVSDHWIPKRVRITPEAKDEPVREWVIKHVKAFGKVRPPQIIDGELRTTYRDGNQETTITTEFVITKALYGNKVVPGDIDASLVPIPAPPAAATGPADEAEPRNPDGPKNGLVPIAPTAEALTAALKNCDGFVLMMGERNILLPNLHTVDDAVLARRILNEVDGNKAIELLKQGSDILIRTPQKDFAKPDLHDGIRFTRTIMEAQEHPEAVADRANKNSVPLTHSPDGVAYFPDAGQGTRPDAAEPQVASPANVRVFALKNACAADAGRIIEQLYKKSLSVAVDERTNSLIVRTNNEIAAEVQALLNKLDDTSGTTNSTDPAAGPAPATLDVNSGSLKGLKYRGVPSSDPNVFSFYLGTTGQTASELQQQYDALERQAQSLSEQLRKPLRDPAAGEKLKSQLRATVSKAFETRQKLQRAELAEFAKRLQGIQQSIEIREKIRQKVIDHRVQELLNPNLKWDPLDSGVGETNLSPPTNAASVNSAEASAGPIPAVPEKTVKIQAVLFDLDETAEEVDFSKLQHDVPDLFEAGLKAFSAKGHVNILSRPQMITRLNQEALLALGQNVPLAKNGDQVTSSRDVGVRIAITPREVNGNPVLKVAFDFSRVDPQAQTNDPDSTPIIQSNSGELTVHMNEYGGKGKLLGPFKAVPGKNRFLHLVVTPVDDVAESQIPPVLQGSWQLQEFVITGNSNDNPLPEHLVDGLKRLAPIEISGNQMIRTQVNGTKRIYTLQYDSTTTPHRLLTTESQGGREHTQRYIVQVNPGYLRLGATTDGHRNFPESFDEPRTAIQTFKRVQMEPAEKNVGAGGNGSPSASASGQIKLEDLQGNWRLISTGQASGKDDSTKTERQVLDATIRGKRLTASTNPVQAAENKGKSANSPMRMLLHLDGVGDPQPVDLEYVLEASEAAELEESIDFYALRKGKPIAQAIIERRGDGFRICIEHAKIVGRPLAFELGETAILWELRPIDPLNGEKVPDQPAATSQSSTDLPENSPRLKNRIIPSSDQSSPQAVLDTIRRCQEQKDYAGFVALLSDEEAARMTGIMLQSAVSFAQMIGLLEKSPNPAANPDLLELQKLNAIVDRYTDEDPDERAQASFHQIAAISERQMAVQIPGAEESSVPLPDWNAEQYSLHLRTAARVISDQRAFLADMMKAMEDLNPSQEKPAVPKWRLEVNGDQAVATSAVESKDVSVMTPATTQLRRVDGHWQITSLTSDEHLMKLLQISGSDASKEPLPWNYDF